ncbi:cylicin-2-like [Lytechinus variegatus]|uniref:cylicin-2-like n=1 Tax=Lytechinus variegatus TaxID=7654 RepID=UPI001BB18898|nr:cylicin-2-like [Lytechinus variegatus]
MMSPDSDVVSHDTETGSPDRRGPIVVHEGAISIKSRIMFCTRWKSKYVKVRADTKQLAIYDKKVSANSTGKRGECLLIQLKQVVECRADVTSKKRNSFLIQKTPNAGSSRQIIFGCVNPADRDRWVHIINDVMNGTITGQSAFDEVVVSSSALTHIVKTRPKNPGRRPPGHRSRALVTSPTGEISSFGDDADSGVGASSELLAAHSTVHKLDGDSIDEVIEQSPTSQESVERRAESNECLVDIEEDPKPKTEKVSTLQRLKKQKKGESKTSKQEKNASFFSRLGSRISRALSRSQSTEESTEQSKNIEQRTGSKKADGQDHQIETEGIKEEETIEEVKLSPTFHAMPSATKSGHDKVIMELAAIAQNAKLVAAKAEALKSARLQGDSDSSGEESSGTSRTLSRRDSEMNIEQAAENLRTTLQNLSEAELLEMEKTDSYNLQKPEVKPKPDTSMKMKMDMSVINEMEGFFAKSNKSLKNSKENGDKAPVTESVEAKENNDVKGKDKDLDVKEKENGHDDSVDSKKEEDEKNEVGDNTQDEKKKEEKEEKDEKKDEVGEDENEKESKTDESSNMKEPESEENEESRKKEEIDTNVSQDSTQVKSQENEPDNLKLNGDLNDDGKTTN